MNIEGDRMCCVLIVMLYFAVCENLPSEEIEVITLKGKKASQSNTNQDKEASKAIDGDINTWSDTSSSNDDSVGWWKVDLNKTHQVASVSIISPDDPYDAYNLQQFQIKVLTKKGKERLCATYTAEPFEPGATKNLRCPKLLKGRFVMLKKLAGSYRKDAITIAEIQIYTKKGKTNKMDEAKNKELLNGGNASADSATSIGTSYVQLSSESSVTPLPMTVSSETNISSTTMISESTSFIDISSKPCTCKDTAKDVNTTIATEKTSSTSSTASTSLTESTASTSLTESTASTSLTVSTSSTASTLSTSSTASTASTSSTGQITEKGEHLDGTPYEILRNVTQIGTYGYHIADFAIDGNDKTCAIACHPCDQSTEYGYGWWQYDFGSVKTIGEVNIRSCPNQHEANHLRDIIIGVSIENTTDWEKLTKCLDFGFTNRNVPTSRWLNFKCFKPVYGRYLLVIRKTEATYRPDVISLAGIKIKDQHGLLFNTTGIKKGNPLDPKFIKSKLKSKQWYKINRKKMKTEQAGVFDMHESKFAIDGDIKTYAVACENCNERIGLGWWKINLKKVHKIVAVQIVSSTEDYDSNYLQEFIVGTIKDEDEEEICVEYINRTYVPPSTTIYLSCDRLLEGDELIVRRREGSSFRADAIAIAEILIYAQY